mgnify:CR=1 FL=1
MVSRRSNRRGRPLLCVLFVLLVSTGLLATTMGSFGCQTTSGAAGKATGAAADVLLPPSDEEKLGDQFSADVEEELDLHPDPDVQAYIQKLGALAIKSAGDDAPDEIEFEFKVVDDPQTVNAFAGPGGQIYFYSGLLLEADNTAEVLAVMCHEVAHVTERHIAERLVTMYGMEALASAALGRNPSLLAQIATTIGAQGFLLKYSRDQERQADSVGLQYMVDTPYDPNGFVTFFRKLEGGTPVPTFLSSHPSPTERVNNLQTAISKKSGLSTNLGIDEHQLIKKKLAPPETSEEGTGSEQPAAKR